MKSLSCSLILGAMLLCFGLLPHAQAVVVVTTSGTTTTTTTNTITNTVTASNWYATDGSSGLDYVGVVDGASVSSGVYLGNGWVITAAHVGSGTFTLGGYTYTVVAGSTTTVSSGVDLTMFQVVTTATLSSLSSLTISQSNPKVNAQVVMIGCSGQVESWGINKISQFSGTDALGNTITGSTFALQVSDNGTTYTSTDFGTAHSNFNPAEVAGGDSGGGAFVYNSTTGKWELAGILEALDSSTGNSFMVNLASYYSEITSIMSLAATPEPTSGSLFGLGSLFIYLATRRKRLKAS